MNMLRLFFSKSTRTILVILGGVVGVFALIFKGYRMGERNTEAEQKERNYEAQKLRADVAEEVNAMSDAAVHDELRQHIENRDK